MDTNTKNILQKFSTQKVELSSFLELREKAAKLGKSKIDIEVIHEYFWRIHPGIVEEHKKKKPDCFVLAGQIKSINDHLEVDTLYGLIKVDYRFIETPRVGEYVSVHWGYACEKLTETEAKKITEILERLK